MVLKMSLTVRAVERGTPTSHAGLSMATTWPDKT